MVGDAMGDTSWGWRWETVPPVYPSFIVCITQMHFKNKTTETSFFVFYLIKPITNVSKYNE